MDTLYHYHQLAYPYEYIDRVLYEAYFSNEIIRFVQRTIYDIQRGIDLSLIHI